MQQILKRGEFLLRRQLQQGTVLGRKVRGDRVKPNDAPGLGQADVGCIPVLKEADRRLVEEVLEQEVRDATGLLGRADTRFFKGAENRLGRGLVEPLRVVALLTHSRAMNERLEDARSLLGIPKEDVGPSLRGKPVLEVVRRTKHHRFEKRNRGLRRGLLPTQQGGQLASLAIGEEQRVVVGEPVPPGGPRPRVDVTVQDARAALDLDEEEPHRREDQGVHLVDCAVIREELEVRPRHVGLVVGQARAQVFQCLGLPSRLGLRDGFPALR